MIYVQLFLSFLQIGMFSFGGGYAALKLIQQQVVTIHHWLSPDDFSNLITISQMTPGPIAINSATFVGTKIAGIGGAIVATLGCILPSCFIVSILAYLYNKYRNLESIQTVLKILKPAVIAMITGAGLTVLVTAFWNGKLQLTTTKWDEVFIFVQALFLLQHKKWNPILVMVMAAVIKLGISCIIS